MFKQIVAVVAGFDGERPEQYRNKEPATLELRGSRTNDDNATTVAMTMLATATTTSATSAGVPFAGSEDDHNLRNEEIHDEVDSK